MNYLAERDAIAQTVSVLLHDSDRQQRTLLIDRQLYRITVERLTDPKEIDAASRQVVGKRE